MLYLRRGSTVIQCALCELSHPSRTMGARRFRPALVKITDAYTAPAGGVG
nr:MAG: hypothetical protein DIU56_16425 [Pseudomonadota bacterium]